MITLPVAATPRCQIERLVHNVAIISFVQSNCFVERCSIAVPGVTGRPHASQEHSDHTRLHRVPRRAGATSRGISLTCLRGFMSRTAGLGMPALSLLLTSASGKMRAGFARGAGRAAVGRRLSGDHREFRFLVSVRCGNGNRSGSPKKGCPGNNETPGGRVTVWARDAQSERQGGLSGPDSRDSAGVSHAMTACRVTAVDTRSGQEVVNLHAALYDLLFEQVGHTTAA